MIFVEGGSKRQREIAFECASFTWQQLMPRIRNCEVNISLLKFRGYHGTCLDIGPREFQIDVDKKLGLGDDFTITIFHEMVHVKQYVRNEMSAYGRKWKKKKVDCDTAYFDLPWEKEAYRMQDKLAQLVWDNDIL